jgi:hypothetical protein
MKIFLNSILALILLFTTEYPKVENIEYKDYIIYNNTVFINIDESHNKLWVMEAIDRDYYGELVKGRELGSVTNISSSNKLNLTASTLTTGTKIYAYYASSDLILAEVNNELKLYIVDSDDIGWFHYDPVISESLGDDFVFFDGFAYSNVQNDKYWADMGYEYKKGDYFDIILLNDKERNRFKLKNNSASLLPVGTKFYKFEGNSMLILADTENGLIPYVMLIEG